MPAKKRKNADPASLSLQQQIVSRTRKEPNVARNPLKDISNAGYNVAALETAVQEAPVVYSESTRFHAEARFRYVAGYLVIRDSDADQSSTPMVKDAFEKLRDARFESLKKGPALEEFKDFRFWVVLLHTYACQGSGRVTNNAAHQNIAASLPPNQQPSVASTSTSAAPPLNQEQDEDSELGRDEPDDDEVDITAQMLSEELDTVSSLPPPAKGTKPLSLSTLRSALACMRIFLRMHGQETDKDVWKKAVKVLSYNARHLHWYPTAKRVKLWLTDEQVEAIIAAIWRPAVTQNASLPFTTVMLASQQVFALCLHFFGIRAASWIDTLRRNQGTEGRFLRWHHITIRFLGYETDSTEPSFLILGSVSGAKHATRQGDKLSTHFQISSSRQPSNMNLAHAFVVLAVLSKVMDENLLAVIESCEFG